MDSYVTSGMKLMGIKSTLENALNHNYSMGIIKKKELDRNLNKVKNHLLTELCSKFGMEVAALKIEEIRNDIECGCSFDNSYIRAVDPERIRKIDEGLKEAASMIVRTIRSIQQRENWQDRKYLRESSYDNGVKAIENS